MTDITNEAAPAPLKKRNVGKVVTAGVATFAGIALAATAFQVTQGGSATYTPDFDPGEPPTVVASPDNYRVTSMILGDLTGSTDEGSAKASQFRIENESGQRGEAMILGVQGDGSDLFGSIQIVITRQDPGNGSGSKEVYRGSLQGFNEDSMATGTYMGDVVPGGVQVFDVIAWVVDGPTTEDPAAAPVSTTFTVEYGVFGYSEGEPADQARDAVEGSQP